MNKNKPFQFQQVLFHHKKHRIFLILEATSNDHPTASQFKPFPIFSPNITKSNSTVYSMRIPLIRESVFKFLRNLGFSKAQKIFKKPFERTPDNCSHNQDSAPLVVPLNENNKPDARI